MEKTTTIGWMTYHVPTDEALLASVGRVAITHGHLERSLKMTVKTLKAQSIQEALDNLRFKPVRVVRQQIDALAQARLGDHEARQKLAALVERAKEVSEQRNGFLHRVWAINLDTNEAKIRTEDHEWIPIPGVEELNKLAAEAETLANELNWERLNGFLADALMELQAP
jgi:hypothetical protein